MGKRSFMRYAVAAGILVAGILPFNNCSKTNHGSADGAGVSTSVSASGDGDFFTGKPGIYMYTDVNSRCLQVSSLGNPFPNQQIFFGSGKFILVRDNCQDVTPTEIPTAEINYNAVSGTISYRSRTFSLHQDFSEFDLTGLRCPAGRAVSVNNPSNYFADPLNLAAEVWRVAHPNIHALLYGSISGLPLFAIPVTSTNPADLQDWYRVGQWIPSIPSGRTYFAQFLLKGGNTPGAAITYWESSSNQFSLSVNLTSGAATILYNQGMQLSELRTVPYGTGWLVSMFFNSGGSANSTGAHFGVAPWRGPAGAGPVNVGDVVYATSAKWHRVDSYCSP